MIYRRRKFKYVVVLCLALEFFVVRLAFSAEPTVEMEAAYLSGPQAGEQPSGGPTPSSDVQLSATFRGDLNICSGALGYKLFRTVIHAKDGDPNNRSFGNLEYFGRGEQTDGATFRYTFNSGPAGQKNVYWPVFYCWSADAPTTALGTAQQWNTTAFNMTTIGGDCTFVNAAWSNGSPKVGEAVTMSVSGTTVGCQGVPFKFEIWGGGSGGCKGVGLQQPKATVNASFPTGGSPPFSVQKQWTIPNTAQYCFKIDLDPPQTEPCARAADGNCLWSEALSASSGGGNKGTASASLEFPNPLNAKDLRELIDALLRWLWWLSIPIAVMMVLYAGLKMMTAGGDPKKFQSGRKILLWVVMGLAVIFIGQGFMALIESILNVGK